jgi:hypothetical protein
MGMFDDMFTVLAASGPDVEDVVGEAIAAMRNKEKAREYSKNYGASPATLSKLGLATNDGVANIKTLKRVLGSKGANLALRTDENVVMCANDFYSLWNNVPEVTRKYLTRKHNNIPEFKPFQYYWDAAASAERANIKAIRGKDPISKTLMTYDGWKHCGQQVMQGQKNIYSDGEGNYYFSFEQTVPIVTAVPRSSINTAIKAEHKLLNKDSLEQYPEWVRTVYFISTPCATFLKRDAY